MYGIVERMCVIIARMFVTDARIDAMRYTTAAAAIGWRISATPGKTSVIVARMSAIGVKTSAIG
jgi:hypothetical protein